MASTLGLLRRLVAEKVEFVLVGGMAAIAHGSASVTEDVDVCIRFDEPTMNSVFRALDGTNPRNRMSPDRSPLGYASRGSSRSSSRVSSSRRQAIRDHTRQTAKSESQQQAGAGCGAPGGRRAHVAWGVTHRNMDRSNSAAQRGRGRRGCPPPTSPSTSSQWPLSLRDRRHIQAGLP